MSELETARAGVFLSILALTLTWLLLSNGHDVRTEPRATQPLAVCASTHGAICDAPQSTSIAPASISGLADLDEVVVAASRLPTPLGHMVVSASRLPDPLAKVRLADVEGAKSVVVQ